MLGFLKKDLGNLGEKIKTETANFEKLTGERKNREAIKKAKVQAQAKEKEFGDADTRQKKLREYKRKAESELK